MSEAWGRGHLVAGKYRLVDKLGEGGMGVVWRADHLTLLSQVALKLVNQAVLATDEGLARFMLEAQAAALVRSPHVVQILDHGVDEGVPYMAMELLDGESLSARLARVHTLSLTQTALLITHVARAMTKAHDAGIVHRDLKPDNVFLVQNDDEELAKVLDFGIAKIAHGLSESTKNLSTRSGALLGTPYYMSPEQVRGHKLDHRTDLWSLAVITFECLVGRVPFDAETVGDLLLQICTGPIPAPSDHAALPAAFDRWFAKSVARPREERFQSAREMADGLRAIAAEAGLSSDVGRLVEPRSSLPAGFALDAATLADTTLPTSESPPSSRPASSQQLDARPLALGAATTIASTPAPPKLETTDSEPVGAPSERDTVRAPERSSARRRVAAALLLGAGVLVAARALTHRTSPSSTEEATPGRAPPSNSARAAEPPINVVPGAPVSSDAMLLAVDAPIAPAASVSTTPSPSKASRDSAAPRARPSATIAKPPPAPIVEPAPVPKKKDELAF